MLLIIFLHFLYGATFTISKILIQHASPIFVIGIRMLLASLILYSIAYICKKNQFHYSRKTIWSIFQIAIFGIFLPYTLRYWSLKYVSVLKTAFMYNLSPFISCALAYIILHERISLRKFIGMFIAFLSIVPMFVIADPTEASVQILAGISWAELAMLASVSSFCYSWIVMKKVQRRDTIFPLALNARTMFLGGILSLGASYGFQESFVIVRPTAFFFWLALIIVMTNIIYFSLYSYLLRRYSATLISLGSLVAPVSAALTSWLYFGEPITKNMLISAVLIVLGFAVFYSEEIKLKA